MYLSYHINITVENIFSVMKRCTCSSRIRLYNELSFTDVTIYMDKSVHLSLLYSLILGLKTMCLQYTIMIQTIITYNNI